MKHRNDTFGNTINQKVVTKLAILHDFWHLFVLCIFLWPRQNDFSKKIGYNNDNIFFLKCAPKLLFFIEKNQKD